MIYCCLLLWSIACSGLPVFYGDVYRPEVLNAFNVGKARAVICTLSDIKGTNKAVVNLRREFPDLPVSYVTRSVLSCIFCCCLCRIYLYQKNSVFLITMNIYPTSFLVLEYNRLCADWVGWGWDWGCRGLLADFLSERADPRSPRMP